MKRIIQYQLVAGLLMLVSCNHFGLHTRGYVLKREKAFEEKGFREGRAHEVRRAYHAKQKEKALPKPPPRKSYYELEIPEHRNADGIWIAPHKTTIGITQS